jgi:hypothetical protein
MTSWPDVVEPGSPAAVAHVAHVADRRAREAQALLDQVEAFLRRFIAFPSEHCLVAATLWAAHTHVVDAFESTPRLALLSPEPGSGKSRVLEVLELLVPRPLHAVNATPAALFRKVSDEAGPPTILFDEVDTLFGPKAKDNEDVRGMLNAGHRRGATALRCVVRGKQIDVEEFPAFCAVALAGLGDLPDTVMTRSVVIRMRRRAPGEHVEAFRHRMHAPEAEPIRLGLEQWADRVRDELQDAWPEMPDGIADRNEDVWESLLAIADSVGGDWPERARVAAVTLVTLAGDREGSLGVRLLADLRSCFSTPLNYVEVDALHTSQILEQLVEMDESPWGDLRGKPLDGRGLARRLKAYGIDSKSVRVGERVAKGYRREDLYDAWERYLPPLAEVTRVTSDTATLAEASEAVDPDVPDWYEETLA